jgi:hypothetical protein
MISKLDRWCNSDNKNRPAIATRINSPSSFLLENNGSPAKQWFADNLRHLPLPLVTPGPEVESSAYPRALLTDLSFPQFPSVLNEKKMTTMEISLEFGQIAGGNHGRRSIWLSLAQVL